MVRNIHLTRSGRWCFGFGGDVLVDRGQAERRPGRFRARHAPPPGFCL
jgi:hypothetical protein